MSALTKFDLHRAGVIGGTAVGAFLRTVDAADHREARALCASDEIALPHRTPTAKLERALRSLARCNPRPKPRTPVGQSVRPEKGIA